MLRSLSTKIRQKLRVHIPERSRLPFALAVAVGVALLLTVVSVSIYTLSGVSKLDLSRPGFEQEREEVRQTTSQKTYDTTSPVTRGSIDEFLIEYDQRAKEIKEYGSFRDQALDDASLQLNSD